MSSGVTEWLDYTGPVQKDTGFTHDAAKWGSTNPVGVVAKSTINFTIPAFDISGVCRSFPYIIAQFNFSAPQPFSMLDWNSVVNQLAFFNALAFFSIRYRVGTQAFRWALSNNCNAGDYTRIFTPLYAGQLIKPQFVIECWSTINIHPFHAKLAVPITINTSILATPSPFVNSGSVNIPNLGGPPPFTNLGLNYPVPTPFQFDPGGAWNSN